ncbi:MAG TPA: c-type cytochrome [Caulobacteraceae bacterium]|nr:c-type cytochrome [Caulobacteraceae bacterium]
MRAALLTAILLASGSPALAADGAALFAAKCVVCHKPHSTPAGPSLVGVVGRKIASLPDFPYSPALKAHSGQHWTTALLSTYLAAPNAFAPGSAMFVGPIQPSDRAAIVAYLKTLKS